MELAEHKSAHAREMATRAGLADYIDFRMLRPGGEEVQRYGRAVRAKPGMTSVLLPVGTRIEISRFDA